jgi:hypothetical protein
MGKMHSSGGSVAERFHDAVTDARDRVTATVDTVSNGATRIVSDVGDKVRDTTNDSAYRAADANELVQEKAHSGVAALHNYRGQLLAIAATASVAIATIVRLAARHRRRSATTPSAAGPSSTAGLVGL